MPWVTLDAPIGCGKTTLLRLLHAAGHDVLEEPVGDPALGTIGAWDPMLARLYAGEPGAALELQLRVVADRGLAEDVVMLGRDATRWGVMERSPQMQRRTFVLANGFSADQVDQICALYDAAEALWRPAAIVCLMASPEVTFARMASRGRPCEEGASLEHHRLIHTLHEKAIDDLRVRACSSPLACDSP